MSRRRRLFRNIMISATVMLVAGLTIYSPQAYAVDDVIVGGQAHHVDGCDVYRSTNFLVIYTRANGQTVSPANEWGYEAAVVNGVITEVRSYQPGMPIPEGGVVLSGHGTSKTWLTQYAKVGTQVSVPSCTVVSPPPPTGNALFPDLGMRPLKNFRLDTTSTPGKKKLRFDSQIANIGKGPFYAQGTRDRATGDPMSVRQKVFYSDGSWQYISTAATMYFAGDGHNHWHIRDEEKYSIHRKSDDLDLGRVQAKHGFCFEDNTSYRDWPSKGTNGAPRSPVYVGCGSDANAASQFMAMSVGWGDTYPSTLPDQYLDFTGLPDGDYRVKVKADGDNHFSELNENNNTTWTDVRISGNSMTVLATGGGL